MIRRDLRYIIFTYGRANKYGLSIIFLFFFFFCLVLRLLLLSMIFELFAVRRKISFWFSSFRKHSKIYVCALSTVSAIENAFIPMGSVSIAIICLFGLARYNISALIKILMMENEKRKNKTKTQNSTNNGPPRPNHLYKINNHFF